MGEDEEMDQQFNDIMRIRDNIERWVVYRDAMMWDKFRELWHPEGVMTTTWKELTHEDFIRNTTERIKQGLNVLHSLGGSAIEVKGNRATAMTKFIFLQRATLDGILCDVTCYGRHYDLWEKLHEKWVLFYRGTIADKDRVDPVNNHEKVTLDQTILEQFPIEYHHLAYMKTKAGHPVDKDCPRMSGGKSLEDLYMKGKKWLNEE